MTLMRLFDQNELVPGTRSLLSDFFGDTVFERSGSKNTVPAVNISEKDEKYVVDVAAPGMDKEDFDIELSENRLKISAKKKNKVEEEGERFARREFSYRTFTRSFALPNNTNKEEINASYEDGILKIDIPKVEVTTSNSKRIQIE